MRKKAFRLKWIIPIVVAVGALVAPTAAVAGSLTLHPAGFGPHSYASWKANQGLPDSNPLTNQALFFQKDTDTSINAAGVVLIRGLAGTAVSDLTGLSWAHRTDGHCGAGAPRWDIFVTGASGTRYTLFLGCSAAAHADAGSDANGNNWCTDSYAGSTITSLGAANAGIPSTSLGDINAGTIRDLAIVFDEGNNEAAGANPPGCPPGQGLPGFVFLDNVTVTDGGTTQVWTSAADNGNGATAARSFGSMAAYADLLASPDQIVAELTDLFPNVDPLSWVLYPNVLP